MVVCKGEKNNAVILKELGYLIECAKILGFVFPVCVVFGVPTKKQNKGQIKAIVHSICRLTCVEKMKAIHFPRKLEWSLLTRTRS